FDCAENLLMFHFGGHADQNRVVLDGFKDLDKIRLSRLLLPQANHHLQLIFLNGCLSYGHVGVLTAKGVKAIIATNVEVDDSEATRLAAYFYKLFFERAYTLKAAFQSAEATVRGSNSYPIIVNPGEIDEHQEMPSSWTLFVHARHTEVMNWKLEDFVNHSNPERSSTPTQIHSGSGDIVAGDKIGRQITLGNNSTYIENQQTNQNNTGNPDNTEIRNKVVNDDLTGALDLLSNAKPNAGNDIFMLKARVSQLQKNERLGLLSITELNLERNKIVHAILSLI